jgi:uncharacterized protein
MGERERHEHGTFSWTDLGTSDLDAAKAFYSGLFGWEFEDLPIPDGGVYTMARLEGRTVAALYAATQGPPAWLSYVTVDDVDATTVRALELGASAISEPLDVMSAGRMAVLSDPTGAVFALWQPRENIGAEMVNAAGALTLNQLNTHDPESARAFYSALFGWRIEATPGTDTPYWGIFRGDVLNGGMMLLPDDNPVPPHWLVYFGSEDLDAATRRIAEQGGAVMVPKLEVPGGHIVVAQDGQGAMFGLIAGRFDD